MRVPTANLDYTNRDYAAFRELLVNKLVEKIPEYTDTSETDAGIVILEAFANGLDILSMYEDILANDVILVTTQDRDIAILIARILGYTPYYQTTSVTKQVFVLDEAKDVDIIIPAGTLVATEILSDDDEPMLFETVSNLTIPAGSLGDEKDEEGNYLYTVDVAQGETIEDDVVGGSTGKAYETFKLSYGNVLIESLRVFVQTDIELEEWTRVDSFLDASLDETSKVFTAISDEDGTCTIQFGNGIYGAIPPEMLDGISCTYRVGGGIMSNVAAQTITNLDETDLEYLDATFNPDSSYVLGHDMESLEEIKINAPASFRVMDRCITLRDYEDIFMINNEGELYGIYRVQALNSDIDPLEAKLYVQMRAGYEFNESLAEVMGKFLDERVIIGTSYTIAEHENSDLDIIANLVVNRDYPQSGVKDEVREYIEDFFAENKFTFDDTLTNSELEQEVINNVYGVDAFRIVSPIANILAPVSPKAIFNLASLELNASGGILDE